MNLKNVLPKEKTPKILKKPFERKSTRRKTRKLVKYKSLIIKEPKKNKSLFQLAKEKKMYQIYHNWEKERTLGV